MVIAAAAAGVAVESATAHGVAVVPVKHSIAVEGAWQAATAAAASCVAAVAVAAALVLKLPPSAYGPDHGPLQSHTAPSPCAQK